MAATAIQDDISSVLEQYEPRRENLIPIIQDAQDCIGFISQKAIEEIAEYLDLSENDVFGVATFYSQFRFAPLGEHHVRVCRGTACHVRGSGQIQEAVMRKLGIALGETSEDQMYSLERVACFGSCALAPLVVVDDDVHGRMNVRKTEKLIEKIDEGI